MKSFAKKTVWMLLLMLFLCAGCVSASAAGNNVLLAKGISTGKTSITISWKKLQGAKRYLVVYTRCGEDMYKNNVKVKVRGTKSSCVIEDLSEGKEYKFYVLAQKKTGKTYTTIAKSKTGHVVLKNNPVYTNPVKIIPGASRMTIGAGSTVKIRANVVKEENGKELLESTHTAKVRYVSSDKSIAAVSSKGVVKARKKGSCKIYVIAANGVWGSVNVKVKAAGKAARTVTKTVTKTVTEKADSYTITYKYLGTVPKGAPAVPAKKTCKVGFKVSAASVPKTAGYTFSGWTGEVKVMPEENVTVTGYWTPNKHTLTYKYTGKVPSGAPAVPSASSYGYGEKVKSAYAPSLTGYTFSGWQGEVSTMPDKNVTVTGSWSVKQYSVTYKFAGDVPDKAKVPAAVKYAYNAGVSDPEVPEAEGYEFIGWKNTVSTMPAHNVTVTGVWKRKTFTLSYAYNEYTGNYKLPKDFKFPDAPKSVTLKYGDPIQPAYTPSCKGFAFDEEWTTEGGGSVPETMPAKDLTLYGSWYKEYVLSYRLYEGYEYNFSYRLIKKREKVLREDQQLRAEEFFDFNEDEVSLLETEGFESAIEAQEYRYMSEYITESGLETEYYPGEPVWYGYRQYWHLVNSEDGMPDIDENGMVIVTEDMDIVGCLFSFFQLR